MNKEIRKEHCIQMFKVWALQTLDVWRSEMGAWDDFIGCGDLTEEEVEYIMKNLYVDDVVVSASDSISIDCWKVLQDN